MQNQQSISARVTLNPYANKVLGILKLKHDLKDKSEALNKFIEIYGDNILEKEVSEEYTKKILELDENFKENKKMSVDELDALFE